MRYAFIQASLEDSELKDIPIAKRCEVLEVSVSGYHAWVKRQRMHPQQKADLRVEEAGFGKVQLPHKAPTPSSSAMQITTCSDASGRSVTFSSKKFHATALAGLLPIAHIARSLNLFKAAKEVLSDAVPSKRNTLYSPELMFE